MLGVDPGTKQTGLALVDGKRVLAIGVARGDGSVAAMRGAVYSCIASMDIRRGIVPDAVVVEGQQVYTSGPHKTRNPGDIVRLAQMAGVILGALVSFYTRGGKLLVRVHDPLPTPAEWKGQTEKGAHQAWVLEQYGWPAKRYAKSARPISLPASVYEIGDAPIDGDEWSEAVDAMGLAHYGAVKKIWRGS